jgi:hypothetical protein
LKYLDLKAREKREYLPGEESVQRVTRSDDGKTAVPTSEEVLD